MINSFLQGTVEKMYVGDACGDIVLDTGIRDNNNCRRV